MKHIRTLIISFSFLLFFFSFIPGVFAEEGNTYEVAIPSLNARVAPSHSGDIAGKFSEGDTIVSFEEQHGWLMTYYDGQEVWVASQFLRPVQDSTDLPENASGTQTSETDLQQEQITVHTDHSRIRSGAGTDYAIISSAQAGDTYTVLDTSGDWYQIALDNGADGWIASWLTDSPVSTQAKDQQPADEIKVKAKQETGQQSLAGATIVLDPGHGGKDPGSIGLDGIQEKDVIMSVSNKIAEHLRSAGANVVLTRSDDYFLSLNQRVNISHANDADAFISLHYNAFPVITVQGINTYYYDGADQQLATPVHNGLMQKVSLLDRGVRQGDFHVLRENNTPAVLLELGFITNPDDLRHIQSVAYQNGVAVGITNGLKDYFN